MTGHEATVAPSVSIVIPTHNRMDLLRRVLDSLERQTHPLADVEIVVCADGCRDGTVSMLKARAHLPLSVVELPGVGPAAARNAGAEAARAPLLVFLDDDVEPTPEFIQAHLDAHRNDPGSVVVGPYPPVPVPSRSLLRLALRRWWTELFDELGQPGHLMRYTDVLTGNMSVPTQVWRDIGGLDERLRAHEDYEFGIRVMKADVPVVLAERALGWHHEHETKSLDGILLRSREEGAADVLIAAAHPEIRADLKLVRLARERSWRGSAFHRFVFAGGDRMDRAAQRAGRLVEVIDRRGLRRLHGRLFRLLGTYWFVRGVSCTLTSFAAWRDLARPVAVEEEPALAVDLRQGLLQATALLDEQRPRRVDVLYGGRLLGCLPQDAGAQRWRGEHLKRHLVTHLGTAYLHARAEDCALADLDAVGSRHLAAGINRMAPWFGTRHPPYTFREQDQQWRAHRRARG